MKVRNLVKYSHSPIKKKSYDKIIEAKKWQKATFRGLVLCLKYPASGFINFGGILMSLIMSGII